MTNDQIYDEAVIEIEGGICGCDDPANVAQSSKIVKINAKDVNNQYRIFDDEVKYVVINSDNANKITIDCTLPDKPTHGGFKKVIYIKGSRTIDVEFVGDPIWADPLQHIFDYQRKPTKANNNIVVIELSVVSDLVIITCCTNLINKCSKCGDVSIISKAISKIKQWWNALFH